LQKVANAAAARRRPIPASRATGGSAERRDAIDELLGPVDRIQDPLERALGVCRRVLLADDAVVGEPASDELAEPTLDRVVDVRDQRCVGLRLDLEATLD